MRSLFIILSIICCSEIAISQKSDTLPKIDHAVEFLKQRNLSVKSIIPSEGFSVYYSCDSIPFLKKIAGDTIKVWTAASTLAINLTSLDEIVSQDNFGKTVYIDGFLSDSMVKVTTMWETTFIHRHDSLFEIESGDEPMHAKLIFHPKMFQNGKKKTIVPKKYNYLGDQIVLERQWIKNKRKCYTIRINNKEDGEETSYSYTFDEEMHFLFWETCYN